MLTASQVEALRANSEQLLDPITDYLIEDIAKRVAKAGQFTGTASYEAWRLQQLGVSQKTLKKEIAKRLGVSMQQAEKLLTQSAKTGYNFDMSRFPTAQAIPLSANSSLQQILDATVKLARDDLTNITQTMGFVGPDGVCRELTDAYVQACDFAFQKVSTGAQDYVSAIRDATRNLAERGIRTIDYKSGFHMSIEAAVRKCVMGGMGLMQEQISQQNHDDLGCDGWEISAHGGSAPDHEPIQGKQYSDKAYKRLNNSLKRRIGTLNCGHAAFPIIMGVSEPVYTEAELAQFREENEKGVTFDGKHYTLYEATQRQRKFERSIRKQKSRILVDKATEDTEKLQTDQIRLVRLRQEYARFSKGVDLPMQHERAEVAGFTWKDGRSAEKTAKAAKSKEKAVANENVRGIMEERGLAMSLRKPKTHILTENEIESILRDAQDLGIDEKLLRFNKGSRTGFSDERGCINIRGDILPDQEGLTARDRMSQKAVLAHEYYGHFLNHPSEFPRDDWRDEFRASYDAAIKAPNLTPEERRDLMIDAYDRAKEAGTFEGYDEVARRIIYGF